MNRLLFFFSLGGVHYHQHMSLPPLGTALLGLASLAKVDFALPRLLAPALAGYPDSHQRHTGFRTVPWLPPADGGAIVGPPGG